MTEDELNDFINQVYSGDAQSFTVGSESMIVDEPDYGDQVVLSNYLLSGLFLCFGIIAGLICAYFVRLGD